MLCGAGQRQENGGNNYKKGERNMKTGVVDTGGGLRGIYATGVLDFCLEQGLRFDVGIGVSAGSGNISAYIAGQKKRNYQFYVEYSARKRYMSMENFIKKKTYIDLDYVYGTLSNSDGENPLDYDAFMKSSQVFLAVATDAVTGEAAWFCQSEYTSCFLTAVPCIIADKKQEPMPERRMNLWQQI